MRAANEVAAKSAFHLGWEDVWCVLAAIYRKGSLVHPWRTPQSISTSFVHMIRGIHVEFGKSADMETCLDYHAVPDIHLLDTRRCWVGPVP